VTHRLGYFDKLRGHDASCSESFRPPIHTDSIGLHLPHPVYNFISRKVREEGIRIGYASLSGKKSHVKVDGVFPCRCGATVGSKPVAMTVRGSRWIHGRYGAVGASAGFLNQVSYLDSLYFLAMGCDEGERISCCFSTSGWRLLLLRGIIGSPGCISHASYPFSRHTCHA